MTIYSQEVLNALLRSRLPEFTKKSFQVVSPSDTLLWNWHLDVITDYLERCARGEIKRLIITVPPRSLKSICASVAFPAWVLGQDPSRRIVCASYSGDLSSKLARDCRAVMETPWYRQLFPHTRLLRNVESDFVTTRQGYRYATSVGGTLTGRGGSIIIIDDPMKPQDAMSETTRKNVKQWYDNTLFSRLDNKRDDVIILVMQRLHLDDLVAHVLEKEEWVHIDLPAIAEVDQEFVLSDGRRYTRSQGGILHPEREPEHILKDIENTIGSMTFSAQYQQRPVPEKGNLINKDWFQYYDEVPARLPGDKIIQSWDTAVTTSELSDYSVCTTWLVQRDNFYLLDVYRARLQYPALIQAVVAQKRKFNASPILIEDVGTSVGLIQQLRAEASGLYIIRVKPDKDKVTRMSTASVAIQAERVHLPIKAPWLEEFMKEMLAFPGGTHDDQVDSVSQFLNHRLKPRGMSEKILRGF